ncbi:hypothetical protein K470DRAFT_260778 [Piedraia hortae CBS 480.64]|uniref:Tyrosine specific protein phosphatases domain-containing protein n=1 Tax=Piedraia hortae CBS 480.64 TaxID=1314780 RepID=A0A6A7BQI6_9PEZI|nr:hypothetical protein K470DRAFT_260778 [Piedraia hortae CBS 480.64]
MSKINFDRILNFRDVGATINSLPAQSDSTTTRPVLKQGILFRSARPDAATPHDISLLRDTLGIKTIIDLRTPTEHAEAEKSNAPTPGVVPDARPDAVPEVDTTPLAGENNTSSKSHDHDDDDDRHHHHHHHHKPNQPPTPLTAITHRINLNGPAYTRRLLSHLPFPQKAKLAFLYVTGSPKPAISILGSQVMTPRGLGGLAIDTLLSSTKEIRHLFSLFSEERNWPVLVHCSQGKDRTGLVVLLLLRLVGVGVGDVGRDYASSEDGLVSEREEKVVELRDMGLPEGFADCEPGWEGRVCGFLDEKEGGVEAYLVRRCGVSEGELNRVKGRLVA